MVETAYLEYSIGRVDGTCALKANDGVTSAFFLYQYTVFTLYLQQRIQYS